LKIKVDFFHLDNSTTAFKEFKKKLNSYNEVSINYINQSDIEKNKNYNLYRS